MRRLFAQLCATNNFRQSGANKINFFRRRIAAKRKTDERIRQFLFANRQNDVRRLNRTRRTSRTARSANAFDVQTRQKCNAVRAANDKGNGVCQTIGGASVPRADSAKQFRSRQFFQSQKSIYPRAVSILNLSKTGGFTNFSSAATKPIIPARFSVPARRSFSCPPPINIGSGCNGDLM